MKTAAIVLPLLLLGCTAKPDARDTALPPATPQSTVGASSDADSARAFVQRFYDWYLATGARDGHPYDSLLTSRRAWLGDSLATAFAADVAMQRADTVAEIASLSAEADVFLNSQDPCAHYRAQAPRIGPGGAYAVVVAGDCGNLSAQPNLEVHVRNGGSGWRVENITDPTDSTFRLVQALIRYRADQDSAGRGGQP